MKNNHLVVASLTLLGLLQLSVAARAQVVTSDPNSVPTPTLSIDGGAPQAITLVANGSGIWDISSIVAEPGGIEDAPSTPAAGSSDPNDPYLAYGFYLPAQSTATTYTLTYPLTNQVIPAGGTLVNASLALTITNNQRGGTYSISSNPAYGNGINLQYAYLGTAQNPTLTDAGVDVGDSSNSTWSSTPNSASQSFFAPPTGSQAGPVSDGSYTQMTIVTSFVVPANVVVTGSGSFDVLSVPEPSTFALGLSAIALLLGLSFRRAAKSA